MKCLCCNILKKGVVLTAALAVFGNSMACAEFVFTPIEDNNLLISSIFDENEDIEIKNIKVIRRDADSPYKVVGSFSGAKEEFGIDKGVCLSNFKPNEGGCISNGPEDNSEIACMPADFENESESVCSDNLINFNAPSGEDDTYRDEDIEKINGNIQSSDIMLAEFDVIPKGKKISFDYVFFSQGIKGGITGDVIPDIQERYQQGTAMGIWVNGKNIAFIPGTNLPVNSVNIDDTGKYVRLGTARNFFRTPMFNSESSVEPNKPNHIKIVLANALERELASYLYINGKFSDFSTEPEAPEVPEEIEEKPAKEKPIKKEPIKEEQEEPIIENPKTGDMNLCVMAASTLASVSGLVVLVKKYKVK